MILKFAYVARARARNLRLPTNFVTTMISAAGKRRSTGTPRRCREHERAGDSTLPKITGGQITGSNERAPSRATCVLCSLPPARHN